MTDFIVSARKYRPTDFESVIGQTSVTSTLQNAIQSNQLAQSFLFCGPRGVGKTSCARIFAKKINQFNNHNKIDDFSFNIFELDAASNNSVDDIRNLTDQVRVPPQVGRYKVYIIDEVHMLSQAAFNAFLKTLEEPPAHAKFVLATTEKHKIIPTILSRCQIFDFKRVSVNDITAHLDFIAKSEGFEVEKEALHLIAQKSDGSIRDSLSLFDRLISCSEQNLTFQSVIEHLNILDYDYYFNITDALLKNDVKELLNIFNEILDNGFDGHHFINGLANHLRDILISKDELTHALLEKGDGLTMRYLNQSKRCEIDFLLSALSLCNDCDIQYKNINNKRLLVELTLMRISSISFGSDKKKKSKSFVASLNDEIHEIDVEKKIETNHKEKLSSLKDAKDNQYDKLNLGLQKKSSLISISGSLNNEEETVENHKSSLSVRNSDFSQSKLLDVWKKLIIFMKEKGKLNLSSTLGMYEPNFSEGCVIEFPLSNAAQQEIIIEYKYMILEYLRDQLENDNIEIITNVIEMAEKRNIPYTNKDRFKKMLDENPKLEALRTKLGLEPDY